MWNKRTTFIVVASLGAGAIAWYVLGSDEEGGPLGRLRQLIGDAVNALIQKGARLTHCPYDTSTGVAPCSPQDLADQAANGDLEAYALARAIASEEGSGDSATQLAVGWAIKNYANAHSGSVATTVLHAVTASHSGFFGTQRDIESGTDSYQHSDRYCSTALDPYAGHLEIAQGIQTGEFPDPTGGAIKFDRAAHDDNPTLTAANRAKEGLVIYDVPGADPGIRFWGPATA